MSLRLTILLAGLMALPLPMLASTTYTYTGNDFDKITGSTYSSSDFITGSFTVAAPLAANFVGLVHPISFSFADGVQTTDNGYSSPQVAVVIDANGNILYWNIQFGTIGAGLLTTLHLDQSTIDNGQTDNANTAEITGDAGIWKMTTVPEPSTLALAGTGLLAMAGAIRRKLRN